MAKKAWYFARVIGLIAWYWVLWIWDHKRWVLIAVGIALVASSLGRVGLANALIWLSILPGLINILWLVRWPNSHERWAGGPARRHRWRAMVRQMWPNLTRECGLSVARAVVHRRGGMIRGASHEVETVWVDPELVDVRTIGNSVHLTVRCRVGQTPDDLAAAVPQFAAAFDAVSHQVRQVSPSEIAITLVMDDGLAVSRPAVGGDDESNAESVRLGRREDGTPWCLQLNERHTLVAGCSGAGKGSVLWGICGGLAPQVNADSVRLYGIDLKAGLEIGMGRGLFTSTAITHPEAIELLRRLVEIIQIRGAAMIGVSRKHDPAPGDPLHLLVIDELAALIAYENDAKARAEALRLLSLILSQGRALGVLVVGFVQDPSKETVKSRNLFTQTVALRLRSSDETRMVLGDGMADRAPAHKISPNAPGTAWVISDDGATERVRADFWPDSLVKDVASCYPAAVVGPVTAEPVVVDEATVVPRARRTPRTKEAA